MNLSDGGDGNAIAATRSYSDGHRRGIGPPVVVRHAILKGISAYYQAADLGILVTRSGDDGIVRPRFLTPGIGIYNRSALTGRVAGKGRETGRNRLVRARVDERGSCRWDRIDITWATRSMRHTIRTGRLADLISRSIGVNNPVGPGHRPGIRVGRCYITVAVIRVDDHNRLTVVGIDLIGPNSRGFIPAPTP